MPRLPEQAPEQTDFVRANPFDVPDGGNPADHMANIILALQARIRQLEAPTPMAPQVVMTSPSVSAASDHATLSGGRRRLPDPSLFSGKRDEARLFIEKVDNVIEGEYGHFTLDAAKRSYLVSLLSGDAFLWYSNLASGRDAEDGLTKHLSYDEIKSALLLAFRDSDEEATAQRKILSLRQGKGSCQDYAIKFRQYAYRTGWNDTSRMTAFREGLREDLQDRMATLDPAKNLDKLIDQAITIDDRLFRLRAARARPTFGTNSTLTFNKSATSNSSNARSAVPTRTTPVFNHSPGNVTGYEPMDLSATGKRAPLSQEEKDRRTREGLCRYCGQPGHIASNCPVSAKNKKGMQFSATVEMGPDMSPRVEELDSDYSKNE